METPTTTAEDEVLTVPEAAKLIRMSVAWVYQEAKTGRLPAYKAGRSIRFTRRTLIDWLEQQKVPAHEAALGGR